MHRISCCNLRRRALLSAAIFATGVLAAAIEARGVILYSSDTRNTTPPSASEGLAAWNLEATWGGFLATPIDATHFLAASHIGLVSSTIMFQGMTYNVNAASGVADIGNSDLVVYSIVGGAFPTHATLYDSAIDGSEVGKTLTVIGRGTQRGSPVDVGSTARGWQWGAWDGLQSWGQNVVTGFTSYAPGSPANSLLYFNFDANGIANEAAFTGGDSSGGVFIYSNGQWKLAGINYAVSGSFSFTGTGPESGGFNAAMLDMRGLYVWDDATQSWKLDNSVNADPGGNYASSISNRLGWIQSVVPGVTVPEPGTLVLLMSAGLALSVFGWRARCRKLS